MTSRVCEGLADPIPGPGCWCGWPRFRPSASKSGSWPIAAAAARNSTGGRPRNSFFDDVIRFRDNIMVTAAGRVDRRGRSYRKQMVPRDNLNRLIRPRPNKPVECFATLPPKPGQVYTVVGKQDDTGFPNVMAGAGPPSTTFARAATQVMDGAPSPTMTRKAMPSPELPTAE